PDRVHREARTTPLGPVVRHGLDEVEPLAEGASEIAVEVVAAQVELGNRDEDHVPQAPRCPTTERLIPRPRGEAEELLLLVDTGLVSLRGDGEREAGREACRPHGLSPRRPAQTLCAALRYARETTWSRSPSSRRSKTSRKAGSRRSRNDSGRTMRIGRWRWSRPKGANPSSRNTSCNSVPPSS